MDYIKSKELNGPPQINSQIYINNSSAFSSPKNYIINVS